MRSCDLKIQRQITQFKRLDNDKRPAFVVELKIFTRFVFNLVSKVSGRGVP